MFRKFIENPVLSTVISIIIVILGLLGLASLPISQYPEIAPPTVVVNASYQGASADVVLKSVIIPLEEQINGVENMSYMTSTASSNGSAAITIFFKQGTNPDMAAVNVQNRVAKATSLLPVGIIEIQTEFLKGDIIKIVDEQHNLIGLGIAEYGSDKARERIGQKKQKALVHYDYFYSAI